MFVMLSFLMLMFDVFRKHSIHCDVISTIPHLMGKSSYQGEKLEVTVSMTILNHLNPLTNDYFYSFLVEESDSSLSGENLTFFKEPIGMDSIREILRYAETRRVIQLFTVNL